MSQKVNTPEGEGENTLMRVLTGILEDSVQTLQRIEKAVNESTKLATEMVEKIQLIDKKMESGFLAVVKTALPSLEAKFIEKIDKIGQIGEVTTILPEIINKLQQSMQILTIQNLISELDKISGEPTKAKTEKKAATKDEVEKDSKKEPTEKTPVAPSPQEEVAQIQKVTEQKKEKEERDDHLLRPSSFFGK
ncbi:MAG TPA: hypothetical protein VMV49_18085 [Candidatus Deferrimicrobium sp.]|nr:hypothetical protein [Candidatus Deferrimicrobium sp.]